MPTKPVFRADTEEALWQQVSADLNREEDLFEYAAELHQGGYQVLISVDIDLGGGFESGLTTTTLTAPVPGNVSLRFALHEQDWVHEIGKLLGIDDVELGDPALDAAFIITTNDPAALQHLLLHKPGVRDTLLRYPDLRLTLAPASPAEPLLLTFTIDQALTQEIGRASCRERVCSTV